MFLTDSAPANSLGIPADLERKLARLSHNPNMTEEDVRNYLTTPSAREMLGNADFLALQGLFDNQPLI